MSKVHIDLKERSYDIIIGSGILEELGKEIRDLALGADDYKTALEVDKDEAKLLGIYPANKIEGDINLKNLKGIDFEEFKTIKEMNEDERKLLINKLSKICGNEDNRPDGENQKKD